MPHGARGRFAPSPTGPLHLGSLVTAVASYLDARTRGGEWLVRLEDVDQSREVPGAADLILRTLDAFGFAWDGPVVRQSLREPLYAAALERLGSAGLAYRCSCTRARLAAFARTADGEVVYPGTCRGGAAPSPLPPAWRFRTDLAGSQLAFDDEIQGGITQDVATEVGDFVIRRRDGFFAYQLAVVVDDADQGIDRVVRGCDLLDNTPRQILLQAALGLPCPVYAHVPVVTEPGGGKLSKSRRAVALDPGSAPRLLHQALSLLRQGVPPDLARAGTRELWVWAMAHWRPGALAGTRTVEAA